MLLDKFWRRGRDSNLRSISHDGIQKWRTRRKGSGEDNNTKFLKILEGKPSLNWEFDEEPENLVTAEGR